MLARILICLPFSAASLMAGLNSAAQKSRTSERGKTLCIIFLHQMQCTEGVFTRERSFEGSLETLNWMKSSMYGPALLGGRQHEIFSTCAS